MLSRNPKALTLALALDTMAQLSSNLVMPLDHVCMSILRNGLDLKAMPRSELSSIIGFECRLRIRDQKLHGTKERDPLHEDAVKDVGSLF